jgi:hypothetical protein
VDLLRRMEQQHRLTDTVSYPFHFALGPKSTLQQKCDFLRRTADEPVGTE